MEDKRKVELVEEVIESFVWLIQIPSKLREGFKDIFRFIIFGEIAQEPQEEIPEADWTVKNLLLDEEAKWEDSGGRLDKFPFP